MPIAHSLNKVTKNLSKATGQIHPKGRKFKQLNKATLREQKITHRKLKHKEKKENDLMSTKYIQQVILEREEKAFTLEDMKSFIANFLARYDEELGKLRKERRAGRPASTRQQILEEKLKYDNALFETGYYIPDLSDEANVRKLRDWNGTSGGLTIVRFIHVSKDMERLPNTTDEIMNEV